MVLDAELVAIDRDKANELKSFQELSTRARGAIAASEVPTLSCLRHSRGPACQPVPQGTHTASERLLHGRN